MSALSGQCLCGGVTFNVTGNVNQVSACYCSQCRAQNGGGAFHGVECSGELTLTNEENLRWYASSDKARRGFCNQCGSSLFWQSNANKAYFDISLGALPDAEFELDAHIFVGSKAGYQTPAKNAPHFIDSSNPLLKDSS